MRSCYSTDYYPVQGSDYKERLTWQWASADAPLLPFPTCFSSRNWDSTDTLFPTGKNPPPPPVVCGEVIPRDERDYENGGTPPLHWVSTPLLGAAEQWANGLTLAEIRAIPQLEICCGVNEPLPWRVAVSLTWTVFGQVYRAPLELDWIVGGWGFNAGGLVVTVTKDGCYLHLGWSETSLAGALAIVADNVQPKWWPSYPNLVTFSSLETKSAMPLVIAAGRVAVLWDDVFPPSPLIPNSIPTYVDWLITALPDTIAGLNPDVNLGPAPVADLAQIGAGPIETIGPLPVAELAQLGAGPGETIGPAPVADLVQLGVGPGAEFSPSTRFERAQLGAGPGETIGPAPVADLAQLGAGPIETIGPLPVAELAQLGAGPGETIGPAPVADLVQLGMNPDSSP